MDVVTIYDLKEGRTRKFRKDQIPMTGLNRRATLAMLGFAPATAAVGLENFHKEGELAGVATGSTRTESLINGLRNLIEQIEADRLYIEKIGVSGEMTSDDIMRHELKISFFYAPDKA
jgi:hypothetical protein